MYLVKRTILLLAALAILPLFYCGANAQQVPSWVKNNAKWWSDGQLTDSEFLKGIQYLIDQGLLDVSHKGNGTMSAVPKIPSWVRTDAGWWADGMVPDSEFLKGMGYLVSSGIIRVGAGSLVLSSPAFANDTAIPSVYTCDGTDLSPPLEVSGIPSGTTSLALTVVDIDAPAGPYTHWTVWNILPNDTMFSPGKNVGYPQGKTSAGTTGYHGPCPPFGTHRYIFSLYALDKVLDLTMGASRGDLEDAIRGHVVEKTQMIGTYSKG